ncbi:MAG: hypothetical protein DRN27_06640 [Thermoplasmata archaeon]|nr:MAG: hypothetical protein DRN27_06640 [Thermoplasmata archaeon]
MNNDTHWYIKATRFAQNHFSWLNRNDSKDNSYFTEEYIQTLRFSGLDVTKNNILTLSYMVAFLSFIILFSFDSSIIVLYYSSKMNIDLLTIFLLMTSTIFLPLIFMNLIASYPKVYVQYIKIHSLGDIPEILSYLVMYLKLVPNLENSVKFAARESSTTLSKDLRKMLWDMEIRIHHGIHDGLTAFANQWGSWSDHLKRALHLIRSSIDESDESQRIITLNKALDVGLEGTRDLMHEYAEKLHQPTLVIYSIGIMIPLAIIAMLPAAGLIGLQITIFQIFILYDILLPLFLFLYIRKILMLRPATFNPPSIPTNHPDLKKINRKKHFIIAMFIGIICSAPGFLSLLLPSFFLLKSSFLSQLHEIIPLSLLIIWGFSLSFAYYAYMVYHPVKKIRDSIKQMETEFSDALYIMGKRISEEKSPEESFHYTSSMMKGSDIAQLFSHTAYNLSAIQTNVYDALFSKEYGSLKYIYSDRIHSILRLFVEGIKKSQKSVSISIIKLADHLKDLQQVEKKISETLSELTSTLKATATIFAPMIAGVTLAITGLISSIIGKMVNTIDTSSINAQSSIITGITNAFSLENIEPNYFVFVIGIYIIELVLLLIRFTNGIDEGDDKAEFYYMLGKTLPVSAFVLTISIFISQIFLSNVASNI